MKILNLTTSLARDLQVEKDMFFFGAPLDNRIPNIARFRVQSPELYTKMGRLPLRALGRNCWLLEQVGSQGAFIRQFDQREKAMLGQAFDVANSMNIICTRLVMNAKRPGFVFTEVYFPMQDMGRMQPVAAGRMRAYDNRPDTWGYMWIAVPKTWSYLEKGTMYSCSSGAPEKLYLNKSVKPEDVYFKNVGFRV